MLLIHPLEGELTRIKIGLKRLSWGGHVVQHRQFCQTHKNPTDKWKKDESDKMKWNAMLKTTHKSATPKKGKIFTKNGENHEDKRLQLMRLIVCLTAWRKRNEKQGEWASSSKSESPIFWVNVLWLTGAEVVSLNVRCLLSPERSIAS